MSLSARSWMVTSVGLTLLLGTALGVAASHILFRPTVVQAAPPSSDRPLWFVCSAAEDVESEPGYLYPEQVRRALLDGFSRDLDLSDTQRTALETMLEEKREGARVFWEELRRSYCSIRDGFRADIRSVLDADQQLTFDQMMSDVDEAARLQINRSSSETVEPNPDDRRSD